MGDEHPPKPTSIRLDREVRAFVEQVAASEHRSLSNTVNVLLIEARDARQNRQES